MVLIFALILMTVGISFICWIGDKKSHFKCEFCKSTKNWQSYCHGQGGTLFWLMV